MTSIYKIGIFVINYNGVSSLGDRFTSVLNGLNQLKEQYRRNIDIWIVDNASIDPSVEVVSSFKGLRLIKLKRNVGYAAACNVAYIVTKRAGYNYDLLIFMNNDIVLSCGGFAAFLKTIETLEKLYNKKYLVTALLINGYDNNIDYGGYFIDDVGITWSLRAVVEKPEILIKYAKTIGVIDVHYADGAFLAIPTQVFEELGGFRNNFFMYLEDVDISLKAHILGLHVLLVPIIVGVHYRSSTAGRVSSFALYYILRNTTYIVLSYFGLSALIRSVLFYIVYATFSLLKLLFCLYPKTLFNNTSILKLHHYIIALEGLIDGIKTWMREKKRYNLPQIAYFHVPLKQLGTLSSYKEFIRRKVLNSILQSARRYNRVIG